MQNSKQPMTIEMHEFINEDDNNDDPFQKIHKF